MNKKTVFFLILIFGLGLSIRAYQVDRIPAGFFCDEAANGFNAYILYRKGVDEYGVSYPFFFRSFGDYRNPVTIYSMIPLIKWLGLNEFSVRMTNVIYGSLTVIAIFFLAKKLFDQKTAIFSALLLAISPWHIHFSRTGFEFISFPFYFTLALFFFLESPKKPWLLIVSALTWGIAFYTYYPSQMVIPIFCLFLVILFRKEIFSQKTRIIVACSVIGLIWLLPFLTGIKQGTVLTRFKTVSLFETLQGTQAVKSIFLSYLNHFSFPFLFSKGDIDLPGHFITRHSVRGMGELYLFQLPLILIGAYWLVKKAPSKSTLLLFFWFLVYPLGSIFTLHGPYAHRSIIGVVPFHLLSGIGVNQLIHLTKKPSWLKHTTLFLLGVIIFVSLVHYLSLYFKKYPLYSSDFWGWQYGPKKIISLFQAEKNNYDQLIIIGNFNAPEIFFKFYDPNHACDNCSMGNFESINRSKKQLFAISADRIKEIPHSASLKIIKTIYYPDQGLAFFIGEITY